MTSTGGFPGFEVRPARPGELDEFCLAFPDRPRVLHEERLLHQEEGHGPYLIAWSEGEPVGHVQLQLPDERDVDSIHHRAGIGTVTQRDPSSAQDKGYPPFPLATTRGVRPPVSPVPRADPGRGRGTEPNRGGYVEVELTRFRGHLNTGTSSLRERGVHAQSTSTVSAGVQSRGRPAVSPHRPQLEVGV